MTTKEHWLPRNKRGAICLTIDDVHPTPLARSALDHVAWLQEKHPQLRVTFFTTADWRSLAPFPDGRWTSRVPLLRDWTWSVPVLPRGTFRIDRHEDFCALLRDWPRAEVALHGLHHIRRGLKPITELDGKSRRECRSILASSMEIFANARVPIVRGLCPPGWVATPALIGAMDDLSMRFLASARDLATPITPGATTNGSGLRGVSLTHPEQLSPSLVHVTTNFQATSTLARAVEIIEVGGVVAMKAHLLEGVGSYRALDGLTIEYREFLHGILSALEDRYGEALWWTSMAEIACA